MNKQKIGKVTLEEKTNNNTHQTEIWFKWDDDNNSEFSMSAFDTMEGAIKYFKIHPNNKGEKEMDQQNNNTSRPSKKQMKKWRKIRNEINNKKIDNSQYRFGYTNQQTEEIPMLNDIKLSDVALSRVTKCDISLEGVINILLPLKVYNKIMTYVKLIDKEINGLGLVEQVDKTTFRISDIYLLKQTVSGGSCDIDGDSMVELCDKLIKEGKNPSMLRFWWHSHNTMGTYWSTVDNDTGKQFAGSEYLISLVVNHSGDMRAKINMYKPTELVLDQIGISVEFPNENENLVEECKLEIEEKVTTSTLITTVTPKTGMNFQTRSEEKKIITDVKTEGPFGVQFTDASVHFKWDILTAKYKGFCLHGGRELTEDEMIQMTGQDYNNPYWYQSALVDEGKRLINY